MSENESSQIMVFRPTYEEFKSFPGYIRYMESKGAHKAGVAKIIPPKEWHAVRRYNMKRIGEMEIQTPIMQNVSGQQGLFQLINVQKKTMKVKAFKELSETLKYRPPEGNIEELERKFWKNITFNPPIYGADVPGTIYDKDVKYWNINSLNTILDTLFAECNVQILGVNTAYLYFGMWKTTFPWHTEDMDLYSINYLHHGAPKFWYSIPPEHGKRLETLAKGFFSGSAQDCSQFLRHKMTMISPQILRKFSIPVNKIVQEEGEFMVTFPYGYHAGFNLGFNIAESTNFASERWIEFGKRAKHCQCNRDSVKIDMDVFIKKFQPEEWKKIEINRKKVKAAKTELKRRKNKTLKQESDSSDEDNEESETDTKQRTKRKYTRRKAIEQEIQTESDDTDEEEEEIEDVDTEFEEATDSEEETDEEENEVENENIQSSNKKHNPRGDDKKKKPLLKPLKLNKKKIVKNNAVKSRWSIRQRKVKNNDGEGDDETGGKEIKEETESDEEQINTKKPIRNGAVLPLKNVWRFEYANKNAVLSFNKRLSETETKCSICVYFSQRDAELLHSGTLTADENNKRHTLNELKSGKLLVTELCFALNNSEEASIETAFNLMFGEKEEQDVHLLICAKCHVAVHSGCYGVSMSDVTSKWYCQKCQYLQQFEDKKKVMNNNYENNITGSMERIDVIGDITEDDDDITCCLCLIRGGALKRTTRGRWCHVVCAIALPEVYFEDVKGRNSVNLDALNPARFKLNCIYCSHIKKPHLTVQSACVQCQCGKCAAPFHVTCGFHNGIPLYLGDWPLLIETLCHKHCRKSNKTEKRELASVSEGDVVFAKHKNGRYYQGWVISVSTKLYYKVIFADKSFCFDLPPEDIQGVNATENVLPVGEIVNILWPDAIVYEAEITGHWHDTVSQVRFEDGSMLNVKRADLFIEGEEIPKRVKTKMSYASETANKFFLPDSIRSPSTKRPRVGIRKCQSTHKKL